MLDREIKIDTIILQKKKVEKTTQKPRTVSSQGGGDDVAISTSYLIPVRRNNTRHDSVVINGSKQMGVPSESTYQDNKRQFDFIGNITAQIVAPEEVTPMFRTPCMCIMVGSIEVPLRSVPA